MSLLSSIFGEAPGAAAASAEKEKAPDLFGSKLSIPPVLHKISPTKKGRKGASSNDKANTDKVSKEGKPADDSSATQQPPATEEENDAQEETTTTTTRKKKTKEELKEEEERTIFVGNLPPDINRRALAGIFKSCGSVVSARLRSMAVTGVKLPPEQAGNQVRE